MGVRAVPSGITPFSIMRAQHPLAIRLVAVVELALVLVGVLLGAMVRCVVGTRTEPHEPRLRRVRRLLIAQHPERLVGEILREVIPLFRRRRLIDELVVLHQIGIPVVGLAAEEPIEPIEPLLERPLRPTGAARDVFHGDVVIFSQPERAVAVVLKHLTDGGALSREPPGGAGKSVCCFGDRRTAIDIVIATREKR